MFDIGMWEMLVVGVVALIVVGPQDLPKMFRTLGQVTGRLKGMAREFQTTMNAAASDAGLDEMSADLRKATNLTRDLKKMKNPAKFGADVLKDAANVGLEGIEDEIKDAANPLPSSYAAKKPAAQPAASENNIAAAETPQARSGSSDT